MEFLTSLARAVLLEFPLQVIKGLLNLFGKGRSYFYVWLGALIVSCLLGLLIAHLKEAGVIDQWLKNPRNVFPAIAGFYLAYIAMLLPVLIPYQHVRDEKLPGSGSHEKKHRFKPGEMLRARNASQPPLVFLGKSMKSRQPLYLSYEMRKMHSHVVGSTGSGKTESIILPLFAQDIGQGRGALIMDAKGDRETLDKIRYQVKKAGREKDFLFFSLAYPEKSNTYNPLLRGNATELKDKIISANVWTEEFYKKKSEETLLLLVKALKEQNDALTFRKLYELLSNEQKLMSLFKGLKDGHVKEAIYVILSNYRVFQKDLSGLTADLGMISESEFADILTSEKPEIDLLDAYLNKKIVYFQLNAQGYEETARRFGRIILQDLKTISNYIQAYLEEEKRDFFPVFIDEFSNFAYEQFIEFLNKARGAHLAILIAHQSLGDLEKAGNHFVKQVLENCNIKVVMRQDDPASIETYSKISGTVKSLKDTYQTEEGFFEKDMTGMGSRREVEEFRIKPNTIRELGRGEAAIIIKQPFITDLLQLDYIGHIQKELP
jgi:conjugal transfer pilus assembly protein TraD